MEHIILNMQFDRQKSSKHWFIGGKLMKGSKPLT